jgi:hypothetical protein
VRNSVLGHQITSLTSRSAAGRVAPIRYAQVTGVGVQVPLGHVPVAHESGTAASLRLRSRTSCSIAWAATPGSPCSQTLTLSQPAAAVGVAVAASDATELQTPPARVRRWANVGVGLMTTSKASWSDRRAGVVTQSVTHPWRSPSSVRSFQPPGRSLGWRDPSRFVATPFPEVRIGPRSERCNALRRFVEGGTTVHRLWEIPDGQRT